MDKIKLLALFGESSTGKNSIQHWLNRKIKNINSIVSYTTRPPRDYEKDGREYHFISQGEFEKFINENKMLEYTNFNNWYYGTRIDELDKNKINVGIFNPQSIYNILLNNNNNNNIDMLPIWIQAPEKERLLRSFEREKNPNYSEICRRFLADKKDFSNILFDYEIFLNDKYCDNYYGLLKRPKVSEFIKDKIN